MELYVLFIVEFVMELFEYQLKWFKINMIEVMVLLVGIIVDMKSFFFCMGLWMFDVVFYLRVKGVDMVLVQKVFKELVGFYIKWVKLIQYIFLYKENIVIVFFFENEEEYFDQVLIVQVVDFFLLMSEVEVLFVVVRWDEYMVCISVRLFGEVNVQIIMEVLDGGGYLINVVIQLLGIFVFEVFVWLKEVIDEYFEGGVQR